MRISTPVAAKPKRPARYDLKAQDRKRNLAIQIGLTAIVVVFAVALVLYIVMSSDKVQPGEAKSIRVTSSKLITKVGRSQAGSQVVGSRSGSIRGTASAIAELDNLMEAMREVDDLDRERASKNNRDSMVSTDSGAS